MKDADARVVLEKALEEIEKLSKGKRTEAAISDEALVDAAADVAEQSPVYAWLLARLDSLGVKMRPWTIVIRARRASRSPPPPLVAPGSIQFARGDHEELCKALLDALGPAPLTFDAGQFWRYSHEQGIWQCVEDHRVRRIVAGFVDCPVGEQAEPLKINVADTRGAEAMARDELLTREGRVTFNTKPAGIAFANGFVRIVDGRVALLPHDPEHRSRHAVPFEYAAWTPARTPLLLEFFEALFADCAEDEAAKRVALLQEFAGACLVGDATRYQQCLYLFGTGGNGKSSLLTLLRAVFPPETLASLPPQRWGERFSLVSLVGKLGNFVSETPTAEILDGGAVKAVIAGDSCHAEGKHRDGFEFAPVAGHIFSTNDPIITRDHSPGFWRRLLIVPLTRRFDTDPGRVLGAEARIIADELPGLVAWVIEGAARAQRQHAYTVPDQSLRLLKDWQQLSNNVLFFLTTRPASEEIEADSFYEQYRYWTGKNGYKPVASNTFGERVKVSGVYDYRKSHGRGLYQRRALES